MIFLIFVFSATFKTIHQNLVNQGLNIYVFMKLYKKALLEIDIRMNKLEF